ncbi:MAG: gamma-glutamyl-gamma-aminobutyrate hydrolase family protein [Sedimentisphaerales bacterium]|nr:gamma-glutamyl-gamma-aminobutyrate hydrolase family protein [Sedimentisphaerales bacterium]
MKRRLLFLGLCLVLIVGGCRSAAPPSPLIGITSAYYVSEDGTWTRTQVNFAYVRAVADNGGVPLVLPTIDDETILQRYVDLLDGLVLVGGADVPASAYGEEPHETAEPLPQQRYEFERKLIARWWDGGKPLLGVCLGMQFANVVAGGSLVQDIPAQVGTEVVHRGYHRVEIEPASGLARILGGTEARVLSNHHQAVKKPGGDLKIVAHSADGVVEALERTGDAFGLFVQWHPESMSDTAHRNAIYGALVRAAAASQ